jgi:hypothetical protein
MSALVRTAIGPWTLETSVDPRTLTPANWQACLDPPRKALAALPVCEVYPADGERIRRGLFVSLDVSIDIMENKEIVAVDCEGNLVAILVPRGAGQWGASKNF